MGMLITSTAKTGIRYLICTKDSGKDKKTYRVGSKEAKRAQVERDNWWNCIAKQVRGMQNHSISPKADNKVHPLMQLTAHHLRQRDLTRMTMPQMNMKQIFQKQSTVSLNLEAMNDCENCSRITAQQTSIGISNTPGVMVVEGLDKSITWKPGKHVVHIRLHHHIHAFLMEQKGCNLLKA
jgi:hypothetical protein